MKMKIFALLLLSVVSLSCSSDDSGAPTITNGVYELTGFIVSEAEDLNGDGTSSTNLVNEFDCYNGSLLILNADQTFTADQKGLEISFEEDNTSIACYDDGELNGTWVQNGNKIVLNYSDTGETYSEAFVINGSNLEFTVENGTVLTNENGEPGYAVSDIKIVYTEQ